MPRAWVRIAVIAAILFVLMIGARRWIHHAQLELVPVIVPPSANPQDVLRPGPALVLGRMLRDIREALQPPARPRLAVLTFDDGPYPVETPALVAQLQALRVPATFFLIGDDARQQPAISRRLAQAVILDDRGLRHPAIEVENHTLRHLEMTTLSFDAQRAEIVDGRSALLAATRAPESSAFRPPHGNYDAETLRAAQAAGTLTVLWDVDPGDWRSMTPDAIADNVIRQARAPAIILLHNGRDATIQALPRIVAAYRGAGFQFISLHELLSTLQYDEINDPIKVRI